MNSHTSSADQRETGIVLPKALVSKGDGSSGDPEALQVSHRATGDSAQELFVKHRELVKLLDPKAYHHLSFEMSSGAVLDFFRTLDELAPEIAALDHRPKAGRPSRAEAVNMVFELRLQTEIALRDAVANHLLTDHSVLPDGVRKVVEKSGFQTAGRKVDDSLSEYINALDKFPDYRRFASFLEAVQAGLIAEKGAVITDRAVLDRLERRFSDITGIKERVKFSVPPGLSMEVAVHAVHEERVRRIFIEGQTRSHRLGWSGEYSSESWFEIERGFRVASFLTGYTPGERNVLIGKMMDLLQSSPDLEQRRDAAFKRHEAMLADYKHPERNTLWYQAFPIAALCSLTEVEFRPDEKQFALEKKEPTYVLTERYLQFRKDALVLKSTTSELKNGALNDAIESAIRGPQMEELTNPEKRRYIGAADNYQKAFQRQKSELKAKLARRDL